MQPTKEAGVEQPEQQRSRELRRAESGQDRVAEALAVGESRYWKACGLADQELPLAKRRAGPQARPKPQRIAEELRRQRAELADVRTFAQRYRARRARARRP